MVDAHLLYPGCKVRIVDEWVKPSVPSMEPWRGKIMTVKGLITPHDIMMKETGILVWYPEDIEEIIEEIDIEEIIEEFDFVFSQESLTDFML